MHDLTQFSCNLAKFVRVSNKITRNLYRITCKLTKLQVIQHVTRFLFDDFLDLGPT